MRLRESMADDIRDVFLDTDGLATEAELRRDGYPPATVRVIFDEAHRTVGIEGAEFDSAAPAALAASADVEGASRGDVLVVGGAWYAIIGVEPDGEGMTTLVLSLDEGD